MTDHEMRPPSRFLRHVVFALCMAALFGVLFYLGSYASDARAEREAFEQPELEDALKVERQYYRLDRAGQQMAGMETGLGSFEDGSFLLYSKMVMRILRSQGSQQSLFVIDTVTQEHLNAEFELLSWVSSKVQGEQSIHEEYLIDGKTLTYRYEGPGQNASQDFELPDDFAHQMAVFHRLHKAYAGEALSQRYSTFDSDSRAFLGEEMKLVSSATVDGQKVYEIETKRDDGVESSLIVDANFTVLKGSMLGIFDVVAVDENPFFFSPEGAAISILHQVDFEIEEWRELEELVAYVEVGGEDDQERGEPFFTDNHYHDVKRDGAGYLMTLHALDLPEDVEAVSLPFVTDDEELKGYMQPTPTCQSDHELIVETARELVGDSTDSMKIVEAITDFVARHFDGDAGDVGTASALEALQSGKGDCTEHAALVVALCRAAGLPARNVTGMEYLVSRSTGPSIGFHAWAEVYVGKWIGVDATIPEVGTSARYLHFGYSEPGDNAGEVKIVQALSGMDFEIQSYRLHGGETAFVREKQEGASTEKSKNSKEGARE